jgi:hypothetical protein
MARQWLAPHGVLIAEADDGAEWNALGVQVENGAGAVGSPGAADGATITVDVSLVAGSASGEAQAAGATQTVTTTLQAGTATGEAQAAGATQNIATTLQAGTAAGEAQAPGATQSIAASLLAGDAAGAAQAAGATQTVTATLQAGDATGGGTAPQPAFRGVNATAYGTRAQDSIAPPSGVAAGDLLVMLHIIGRPGAPPPGMVTPAGWTLLTGPSSVTDVSGFTVASRLYWKIATASEPASYDLVQVPEEFIGPCPMQTLVVAYSGADALVPEVVVTTGSGNTIAATGLTPDFDNSTVLYLAQAWNYFGSYAPPTGYTERYDASNSLLYAADLQQSAAGPTGTLTQSIANVNAEPWTGFVVSLAPFGASAEEGLAPGAVVDIGVQIVPGVAQGGSDERPVISYPAGPWVTPPKRKKGVPGAAEGAVLDVGITFEPGTARGGATAPAAVLHVPLLGIVAGRAAGAAGADGIVIESKKPLYLAPEGVTQAEHYARLCAQEEWFIAAQALTAWRDRRWS